MPKTQSSEALNGKFLQVIYSPHGTVEGVLVEATSGIMQLVFSDDETGAVFRHVQPGADVTAQGDAQGWSSTAKSAHRVFAVVTIDTIDGKKPAAPKAIKRAPVYAGKVVALNYARHGEPNGVVLDSGDFIHMKPEGYKRLKLAVGDAVTASGDAYELHADTGYVIEALSVNGKKIR